jgi:hypothetical protein
MKGRESAIIFLLSTAVLGLVTASPNFGDPDAYYHLWMAKLTLASGPIQAFTWLPFTTLADSFADQHFLYHLALIPFIGLFGDFWGLKIATVLFGALALTVFSLMLKAYGVRRSLYWTLPLLFTTGFAFRLLLTKATALALTALFLFLIALRKEKPTALFYVAFAYVWLHAGWPILAVVGLVDAIVRRSARFLPQIFLGLAFGLVLNPFFPKNISFYWEQIVQVAIVGRHSVGVLVGNEWSPIDFDVLIGGNVLVFLPLMACAALLIFAVRYSGRARADAVPPERRGTFAFFAILAAVFLLMTVRQARHKEYFLPLLLSATALLGDSMLTAIGVNAMIAPMRKRIGRAWPLLLAVGILSVAVIGGQQVIALQRVFAQRTVWTRYMKAGEWMRANLSPGEIVFQTGFNDTPFLLYRDDAQRYIIGLDPRFLSDNDLTKYWEWRDISEARRRIGLASLIVKDFDSHAVFLRSENEPLGQLIKKDPSFERVYQDEEAEVWRVKE